jgi:N-methylhydantoinase A/oxoprolinase/acetone carboxylase beta subunit
MEAQIVTVRVIASVTGELAPVATPAAACPPDPGRMRKAFDPASSAFVDHGVFAMERLGPGQTITGPAIIEERGSTVRIGLGATASFRPEGWLQIEITS